MKNQSSKTMDVITILQSIEELHDVPLQQLQWLVERGEIIEGKEGEHVYVPGDSIDSLIIVLEGSLHLKMQRNNQFQVIAHIPTFAISGLLPYSRAKRSRRYVDAVTDTKALKLDKRFFKELIHDCHELTTALVHVMSSRIRQFTKREQQDDKMLALGKLSAGLAHELNNPSAAVLRSSQALSKHLKYTPENFKAVINIHMTNEELDGVNNILFSKIKKGPIALSLLEKSNREDEILDWLDEREIKDSDEIANVFTDFGMTKSDLDAIERSTPKGQLPAVLYWVNQVFTTEKLVDEIENASQRISDLVTSIKSYTHMDQMPEKVDTDIHTGINNTLTLLNHKLKHMEVIKNYDETIPHPKILVGPMNQVWTNLIDNAIDAMEKAPKKELVITTRKSGEYIEVSIQDSGIGIPEDIQENIYDPFFTTKAIGKGTGLGLEFVQQIIKAQHNGVIYLDSEPGKTIFKICIPIESNSTV